MHCWTLASAFAVSALCATPSLCAGNSPTKFIGEGEVRKISAKRYTEILRLACFNGWRFDRESVASGYRRHYEETRLALIDEGYAITPEPVAPRLVIAVIAAAMPTGSAEAAEHVCFRARWSRK